jgi:hypothetical protein
MRARPAALMVRRFRSALPLAPRPKKAPVGGPARASLSASNARACSRRAISSSIAARISEACIGSPWREYRRDWQAHQADDLFNSPHGNLHQFQGGRQFGSLALRLVVSTTRASAAGEMKVLMKSAVNALYRLLWKREYDPRSYDEDLAPGRRYTSHWDDPDLRKPARRGSPPG